MLFIHLEKRKGTIITVGSKKNPQQSNEAVSKTTSSKEATKVTSAMLFIGNNIYVGGS